MLARSHCLTGLFEAMKTKTRKLLKKNIWRESVSYLMESRYYILFVFILFAGMTLISFIFPEPFSFFDIWLEELVSRISGLSTFELVLFIFQNNVTSAFAGLFFGILLGLFPLFNAITNGAVLGY